MQSTFDNNICKEILHCLESFKLKKVLALYDVKCNEAARYRIGIVDRHMLYEIGSFEPFPLIFLGCFFFLWIIAIYVLDVNSSIHTFPYIVLER